MPVYHYAPHELLASYVECFCYNERTFAPHGSSFEILPDSMIELVWSLGSPLRLEGCGTSAALPPCFGVGLLAEPLRITATGQAQVVRARVYPWNAFRLLEAWLLPSATPHFPGLLMLHDPIYPPELHSSSPSADGGAAAVAVVQHLLLGRSVATALPHPQGAQAAQALQARRGVVTLGNLAAELGVAERSLRRHFRAAVHLGPKEFARLVRFEHVRDLLWRTPDASLAAIALDAGYSDQAHMQREFRRFSKRTPGQFAVEMRQLQALLGNEPGRNIQDA